MKKKLIVHFMGYIEIDTENYPGMTDVKEMVKADIDNDSSTFFDSMVINSEPTKITDVTSEAPNEF